MFFHARVSGCGSPATFASTTLMVYRCSVCVADYAAEGGNVQKATAHALVDEILGRSLPALRDICRVPGAR